jgi:hypothetical protein
MTRTAVGLTGNLGEQSGTMKSNLGEVVMTPLYLPLDFKHSHRDLGNGLLYEPIPYAFKLLPGVTVSLLTPLHGFPSQTALTSQA